MTIHRRTDHKNVVRFGGMRRLFLVVLAALALTSEAQVRRGPRLAAAVVACSFGARGVGAGGDADHPTDNKPPSDTPPGDIGNRCL
jgi:hypothetical protein